MCDLVNADLGRIRAIYERGAAFFVIEVLAKVDGPRGILVNDRPLVKSTQIYWWIIIDLDATACPGPGP
jgi:hypothetical protein